MKTGWLGSAYGIKVEHVPCPHPNLKVDVTKPAAGVMHTTEGSSIDGALAVFKQHDTPHFVVGPGRILQLVPLGYAAAALKHIGSPPTNEWARVQIELVGFSQEHQWQPGGATREALVKLLAACRDFAGIPLLRPFPDAMPPKPWATSSFKRRLSGRWGSTAGWFGHIEIPENDHWDPGWLAWGSLLAAAGNLHASPTAPPSIKRVPSGAKAKLLWAANFDVAKRILGPRLAVPGPL